MLQLALYLRGEISGCTEVGSVERLLRAGVDHVDIVSGAHACTAQQRMHKGMKFMHKTGSANVIRMYNMQWGKILTG